MEIIKKYMCPFCNKEYDNPHKLGGHKIKCDKNPKYKEYIENWKKSFNTSINKGINHAYNILNEQQILYCQFCGKECTSLNSLLQHEKRCKKNPNYIESQFVKYNKSEEKQKNHQSNQYIKAKKLGLPKPELSEEAKKRCGAYWKDKHLTEEMKLKNRESTIKYIESCYGECKPRYNKKACQYINQLNKQNNWNLQHAENGGEYRFYGYYVDGYDKDLNIVFEYDESRHYKDKNNNILNDKDIQRQNNIIEKLHCEFWRYNEYLDLLYQIK